MKLGMPNENPASIHIRHNQTAQLSRRSIEVEPPAPVAAKPEKLGKKRKRKAPKRKAFWKFR